MGERLLSRKFWLAVAACLFFATRGRAAYDEIATIVVAYMAVQAAVDFGATWTEGRYPAAPSPAATVPPGPEVTDGPDEGDIAWTGSVI